MRKTTLKHRVRQTETRDKVTYVCMENFFVNWLYSPQPPFLGDTGAVSGAGKSLNNKQKNLGEEKSSKRGKALFLSFLMFRLFPAPINCPCLRGCTTTMMVSILECKQMPQLNEIN